MVTVKNKAPLIVAASGVFAICMIALSVAFALFSRHSVLVDDFEHFRVTDAEDGGSSEVEFTQDSIYSVQFKLRLGSASPHAGLAFAMQGKEDYLRGEFFDFSAYDSLRVKLRTGRMPRATLRLAVSDPALTRPEIRSSARPVEKIVEVDRSFKEVRVALADFKVPERWFSQMGFDSPDEFRYLERGVRLEVLTAHGAMLGIPDELEFYDLELFGENRALQQLLLIAAAVLLLAFVGTLLWISKRFGRAK